MEGSKITFSSAETELMQNAELILTKNRVLQKWTSLLENVQDSQLHFLETSGLAGQDPFVVSPKISRGENYLGLPWLILDYPRSSSGKELFFIRSMFWWGHFFSSTLHLSGRYHTQFRVQLEDSFPLLQKHYISINTDPWIHHFEKTNYQPVSSLTEENFRDIMIRSEHIKIATNWPLYEWGSAPSLLFANWKFLLSCCGLIP